MKNLLRAVFIYVFILMFSLQASAAETVKFENEIKENLSSPMDVAVSGEGNLFVLDAGTSVAAFNADHKQLLSFKIPWNASPDSNPPPQVMAVSPKGLLIIADITNNHIQVLNTAGEIQFAFGAPGNMPGQFKSLSGIDVDALGFIYVSDLDNKRIQVFTPNGIFMRALTLSGPAADVAVDPRGNIYALLPKDGKIEKFLNDGHKAEEITCRPSGSDEIAKASRFHVDPWGDIYLAQNSEERIVKIDRSGKILITFGSEGNARGQFSGISGLAADESGRVYVADRGNARVQIFKMIGLEKTLIPKLTGAPFFLDFESSVEAQEGIVDVFLRPGRGLFSVSDKSGVVSVWDHRDLLIGGDGSGAGQLLNPSAVFVSLDGKIYVADTGNNRVVIFNSDGSLLYQFGKSGNKPGQFNAPQGIAVNGKGMIYVADTVNNRVQIFNHDGIYLSSIGYGDDKSPEGCQALKLPRTIVIDSKDNLYVLDTENAQVRIFDENGQCLRTVGDKGNGPGEFMKPVDITIDQNDNLYVADSLDARVQIFDQRGRFLLCFGSPGSGGGYFKQLSSVTASEGKIYVADYQSNLIQIFKYAPDGLLGKSERLYATRTAPPLSNKESNDVLRYTLARKQAYHECVRDFMESFGFSESYLLRFIRVESIECLNDGQVKVTVSVPKSMPKEILPADNLGLKSGGP